MSEPNRVAEQYIAIWNETDDDRRRAMIAAHWSPAINYRDPLMSGVGHDQLDALISGIQKRFPGFHFTLIGKPDGHADHARFSWGLGPDGTDAPIKGTDFVTLDHGKLATVIGFLDQVPAAA